MLCQTAHAFVMSRHVATGVLSVSETPYKNIFFIYQHVKGSLYLGIFNAICRTVTPALNG